MAGLDDVKPPRMRPSKPYVPERPKPEGALSRPVDVRPKKADLERFEEAERAVKVHRTGALGTQGKRPRFQPVT